jgi:hypothetical protein
LTEKTSRNGKVWDMPSEDVGSRELPQAPMDGFTAFLVRHIPHQKKLERILSKKGVKMTVFD